MDATALPTFRLSPAQRALLEKMMEAQANGTRSTWHRDLGKLQRPHVQAGGEYLNRSAAPFEALHRMGLVGHKPFALGDSGSVPAWVTPLGRYTLGIALDENERKLAAAAI
jgi:hypothetical protein